MLENWAVQLEQGNTGRVYVAQNWGEDFPYGRFGGVCTGTGSRSIRGKNGKNFGRMICAALGFSQALFTGFESEYTRFMEKQNLPIRQNWNSICIPDFAVAGATCTDKDCKLFDIDIFGGACLRGQSDVFVHCKKKDENVGSWTEWNNADYGECKDTEYLRQQYRECKSDIYDNPICEGPFLQVNNYQRNFS